MHGDEDAGMGSRIRQGYTIQESRIRGPLQRACRVQSSTFRVLGAVCGVGVAEHEHSPERWDYEVGT